MNVCEFLGKIQSWYLHVRMRMNRVEYLHLCAHMGGMGKTFSLDYFVRYTVTVEHTKIKYASMLSYVCVCVCVCVCACACKSSLPVHLSLCHSPSLSFTLSLSFYYWAGWIEDLKVNKDPNTHTHTHHTHTHTGVVISLACIFVSLFHPDHTCLSLNLDQKALIQLIFWPLDECHSQPSGEQPDR